MDEQSVMNGGLQLDPQAAAVQIVYLDFDGELTSYNGEILTVEDVVVQDSSLTEERIANILSELNAKYAGQNVIFVTERPEDAEYSTIFVGKTSSFDEYGSFAGLAETVDSGNKIKNDNAFVMLDSTASNEAIIATISHETDHLLGTLDHGGEGLTVYAAKYDITNGETATGIELYYDSMYVSNGGVANNTTVHKDGYMCIGNNGAAKKINIKDGEVTVSSGGYAEDVNLLGGILDICNGGIVKSAYVEKSEDYWGDITVSYGGHIENVSAGNWGKVTVSSGGSVDGADLLGTLYMHGGVASNIVARREEDVETAGNIFLYDGIVSGTVMSAGYFQITNGSALNTLAKSGANIRVGTIDENDQVVVSGLVAETGAMLRFDVAPNNYVEGSYDGSSFILQNAQLNDYRIHADGALFVSNGGRVKNIEIAASGLLLAGSNGIASAITAEENSDIIIYQGGTVSSLDIKGHMFVSNGGYLEDVRQSDGRIYVSSGGVLSKLAMEQEAGVTVSSGGRMYDARISGEYSEAILRSGAVVSNMQVDSGSWAFVYKNAVLQGRQSYSGTVYVYDAVDASAADLYLDVSCRTTEDYAIVEEGLQYLNARSLNITVAADLLDGTYKLASEIDSFSRSFTVGDSSTTYGSVSVGGTALTYNNKNYSLLLDGTNLVFNIGSVSSGGSGGSSGGIISSGGSGGSSGGIISSGGSGGSSGGIISSGGWTDPVISSGGSQVKVYSSGTLVKQGTVLTGEEIVSGANNSMFVYSGGTANSTTVSSGGFIVVSSGGLADIAVVSSGGTISISAGGEASSVTVSSGGLINVYGEEFAPSADYYPEPLHGWADNVKVLNGGSAYISGGDVWDLLVSSGGWAYVGGVVDVSAVDVYGKFHGGEVKSGGSLIIGSGGVELWIDAVFGGTVTVYGVAEVYGDVVFDISERKAADSYIVDNISNLYLTDISSFSISVSATQAYGTYKLAQGASSFNETITVGTGTTNYGTLTVNGAALTYGGKNYALTQTNGNLLLAITSGGSSGGGSGTSSGGTITSGGSQVKVYSSGTLVKQGKVLTGEMLTAGQNNSMFVYSGGTANSTTANSGGKMYVSSGGVANHTVLHSDGSACVYLGGVANHTEIKISGREYLYGGTDNNAAVNGGVLFIYSGGTANYTTVNAVEGTSGAVYIYSGTVNSATVNSAGRITAMSNGAVVNDTIINSKGYVFIYSGAVANDNIVKSGGTMYLWDQNTQGYYGGTANNTLVSGHGFMCVVRSGVANSTTVWGELAISSGIANDTVVNSGGELTLASNAVGNDTIVNSGGFAYVYPTGTVNIIDINSGGRLTFNSGAILSGTHVYGGTVSAFGKVNAVKADVTFDVSQRNTADGYIVNNLSYFDAKSFTITVSAAQAYGTYKLAQGASSFTDTISISNPSISFGTLTVNGTALTYGGKTYSLIQNSGNLTLQIGSGGSSGGIISSGGSGGSSGGIISSGGWTDPVISFGGSQVRVFSSGTLVRQGKVLTGEQIYGGKNNSMFVYAGGTANSTTVNALGTVFVSSGGLASNTVLTGSAAYTASGSGSASAVSSYAKMYVYSGGIANSTTINEIARVDISSGGKANDVHLNSGGHLTISSGGVVNRITTSNWCWVYVGGVANSITNVGGSVGIFSGTANYVTGNGGPICVYDSGTLNHAVINSHYIIAYGGTVNDTELKNAGGLYTSNTCTINDLKVNSNASVSFVKGATITGSHVYGGFVNAYDAVAAANADIVFDLTVHTTNSDYIIDGFNYFSAARSYAITVTENHAYGTYKLAEDAGSFTGTVTVGTAAADFGTITVGGSPLTYGGKNYSLSMNNGYLSLVIGSATSSGGGSGSSGGTITSGGSQVRVFSSGTLVRQGKVLTGEQIYGGKNNSMFVYADGTACSTTVRSAGRVYVSSGGLADIAVVSSGGTISISAGGEASSVTVSSGGLINVYGEEFAPSADYYPEPLHGWAGNVKVLTGGSAFISGGEVDDLLISSGGWAYAAGLADPMVVDVSAGLYGATVKSGGSLTIGDNTALYEVSTFGGTIVFEGYANMTGELVFDVTEREAADSYIVNNLSAINDMSMVAVSITVSATQSYGTYKLAQGASSFNETITVGTGTTNYGTLTVNGAALTYGGKNYALTQTNGNLLLAITSGGSSGGGSGTSSGGSSGGSGSSGGTITSGGSQVRVYSSGILVRQGKVLTGEDIYRGKNNSMFVYADGTACSTTINSDGRVYVFSGGLASNTLVSNGILYVSSGGFASRTLVHDSAAEYISGGIDNDSEIRGGVMYLFADGTANRVTVNKGPVSSGDVCIYSGRVNQGVVNSGGVIVALSAGAYVNSTTINSSGYVFIYSGAVANDNIVKSGGTMYLWDRNTQGYYGGTANNTLVSGHGFMCVVRSGVANSTTVWGDLEISAGVANKTVVKSGGYLQIASAGVVNDTIVSSGGSMDIFSSGKHRLTLNIASGALVSAYVGGIVDFTVSERSVSDGYLINNVSLIKGAPTYTITVRADQADGTYKLAQGASAFTGTLSIGTETAVLGSITVNGGTVTYNNQRYTLTQRNGDLTLTIGGTVDPGDAVKVYAGGMLTSQADVITGKTLLPGSDDTMHVFSGGVAKETIVSQGGAVTVFSSGLASSTIITAGGNVFLSSGGTAEITEIYAYGGLHVFSGATASSTTVYQSGYFGVGDGATTYDTKIAYAGELTVWDGGKVIRNTIDQWGAITLSSGAAANSTTINAGGGLHVFSGAAASNTIVKQDGFFGVGLGAKTYDTTIDYCGALTVWGGGEVHRNEINQWGAIILSSGAIGNYTTINPDGGFHIFSGAVAYTTEITSGAFLGIGGGGSLYNANLENTATMAFYDGSVLRGWVDAEGSIITYGAVDASGTFINFELGERTADQDAILDNMLNLNSVMRYSVEVDTDQERGVYALADGAWNFTGGLALYVGDGNDCGTLSAGTSLNYNGKQYSLQNTNGTLALKIA